MISLSCGGPASLDAGSAPPGEGAADLETESAEDADSTVSRSTAAASGSALDEALRVGPSEVPGAGDRWHQYASGIHPPHKRVSVAQQLELATTVFVGEFKAVEEFYVPPGNRPDAGPEDPVTGTIRFRVAVSSLLGGELPIQNPDESIFLDVTQIGTSSHVLSTSVPRGRYVFVVVWSQIVPQAWKSLQAQADPADFLDYAMKYNAGYSLINRGSLFQVWADGFRAPLLEADLINQVPEVFLSAHDRGFYPVAAEEGSEAHRHGDLTHSHSVDGPEGLIPPLVGELETMSSADLEMIVRANPIPAIDERRLTWEAISEQRLPAGDASLAPVG